MKRTMQTAAWTALFLLLTLGPVWLGSAPALRREMVQRKYVSWTGVLRLWKCEGVGYGKGTLDAWLNCCVAAFEKAHPGVYVQITDVPEGQIAAFDAGEVSPPDMILFAPGMLEAPYSLMELPDDLPVRDSLRRTGCFGDGGYAAPVAMGGYAMAVNAQLLDETPADWGGLTENAIHAPADGKYTNWSAALIHLFCGGYIGENAGEGKPVGEGMDLGLAQETPRRTEEKEEAGREWAVNRLPSGLPDDFRRNDSVYECFVEGKTAAIPVTQREIQRLRGLNEAGGTLDWRIEPMGMPFTDQMTFLAITSCGKKDLSARQNLCLQLLRLLLSEEMQRKLTRSGAFPVRETSGLYHGQRGMDVMENVLLSEELVCAPAFGAAWRDYARRELDKVAPGGGTMEICSRLHSMLASP